MNQGLSDRIRVVAQERYIQPAMQGGKKQFSIAVRDILDDLKAEGFPARNTPQVCSALQAVKFLRENRLEIEGVDGPPSKQSTTVVVRYRIAKTVNLTGTASTDEGIGEPAKESPEEWALRLSEKLRGLLKNELAEYGGGEAFLRWVRSEEREDQNEKDVEAA